MAESPSVLVAESLPKKPPQLKKFTKPLLGIGVVLTVVLAATLLLPKLINNSQKPLPQPTKTKQTSPTASLEKSIKITFSAAQYKAIIDYTNLASQEADLDKRYEYYQKAFTKISQAYSTTKKPEYKLVLYQLKDYVKVFPKYQEGDFVIPT